MIPYFVVSWQRLSGSSHRRLERWPSHTWMGTKSVWGGSKVIQCRWWLEWLSATSDPKPTSRPFDTASPSRLNSKRCCRCQASRAVGHAWPWQSIIAVRVTAVFVVRVTFILQQSGRSMSVQTCSRGAVEALENDQSCSSTSSHTLFLRKLSEPPRGRGSRNRIVGSDMLMHVATDISMPVVDSRHRLIGPLVEPAHELLTRSWARVACRSLSRSPLS
ncbi:uncharacterized protein BDZ83DRAFT_290799 [Colletotrichum acutatum]|uniref:Uncharacterized protein n=1 Tax=Glomerella acutata TaxID=27357 RepID=A0AAD9D2Z3_GLOAC|nr:uncharacterized protein BDZ83DRAFT_290799 [Colletotrichum acutatum]KAK1730961.1 hypothetical protein BDZ83DRAFT_290799 [Colletotrichum acutatum]